MFRLAKQQGLAWAILELGICYEKGLTRTSRMQSFCTDAQQIWTALRPSTTWECAINWALE